MKLSRSDFVRPIILALCFTVLGEFLIFLIWGLWLFPEGELWHKAVWTGTCGIGMGATIGASVILFVVGRLKAPAALATSSFIYLSILTYCIALCYQVDLATGSHFGAASDPILFIAGGFIPALLTSYLYGWLLFGNKGSELLSRIGL